MAPNPLIPAEALQRFRELLERGRATSLREPMACTLATASAEGEPAVRVVLLRDYDQRGFVFYTNTQSLKGQHLEENPRAALCFHWDVLAEQVRAAGCVAVVDEAQADAYWARRPRDSQIGAWASQQSRTLANRDELLARVGQYEDQFADRLVPRPVFWTGYRLVPSRIEFWKGQPARLHERVLFENSRGKWEKRLLYP